MLVLIVIGMKELLRLIDPGLAAGVTRGCIASGLALLPFACRCPRWMSRSPAPPAPDNLGSCSLRCPRLGRLTGPRTRTPGTLAGYRARSCELEGKPGRVCKTAAISTVMHRLKRARSRLLLDACARWRDVHGKKHGELEWSATSGELAGS